MAWVAEGLAVHPDNPKLLQIHDAIQRDQAARRRQARRSDVEDLRRIELKIDEAADAAGKQALAERIQAVAAKHWTDGEILAIANRLLSRLGFVPKEGLAAAPNSKGAPVIFHVPRPNAPEASRADTSPVPPSPVLPANVPSAVVPPGIVPASKIPASKIRRAKFRPALCLSGKVPTTAPPEPQLPAPQAATAPAVEPSAPAAIVASPSSQPKEPTKSNSTALILVSAAAIILVAATFFFTRKHYAQPVAQTPAPRRLCAHVSGPYFCAHFLRQSRFPASPLRPYPRPHQQLPNHLCLLWVFLPKRRPEKSRSPNRRAMSSPLQSPVTIWARSLWLRVKMTQAFFSMENFSGSSLKAGNCVYRISSSRITLYKSRRAAFRILRNKKSAFGKGEQATLTFHLQPQTLQPQPRLASLTIQNGAPGTTVLVDQTVVGTIPSDGTLSVSTVNPGDHTVELRHERFKPRQFKEHFVAGGTISLAAADAALEAAPGELKITFTPADAKVAIAKGELLKMVSSGVPLNLAPGSYTLTARTAERFTRSSTLEVIAGQSKTLDLSLAPSGMSKWEDPGGWKKERDSFIHKGGDFVLYGAVPASGTFVFSAMPAKGHLLQWVLNYSDPKNYILFQMDENNFYRTVIRNGQKTDQIIVPDKGDKKSFRTLQIRVSPAELVHQVKHGDSWTILDRWTQPGANLSLGKFGFYHTRQRRSSALQLRSLR